MRGMENRKWKVESEKLSGLSFRGAKRRGNLAEPGWITGYSRRKRDRLREIATSAYGLLAMTNMGASTVLTAAGTDRGGPSRDCHVGLWPPRNDKYGGQHRFNGGRYGSGRAFPRLPRARSALAMTNQRTLRHRKNTAHAASLHGAHYPQGARRIRKAAKPPTAAQGAPLQTQSVGAFLSTPCTNWKCLPEIATSLCSSQ